MADVSFHPSPIRCSRLVLLLRDELTASLQNMLLQIVSPSCCMRSMSGCIYVYTPTHSWPQLCVLCTYATGFALQRHEPAPHRQ
jgi:hypothetical protein